MDNLHSFYTSNNLSNTNLKLLINVVSKIYILFDFNSKVCSAWRFVATKLKINGMSNALLQPSTPTE